MEEYRDDKSLERQYKSFIKVGTTFVDIKQSIGFMFLPDPNGYIIIQFVYDSGRGLNAYLRNRNDFYEFLLEVDMFIDDKCSLKSMNKFIDEIEQECHESLMMQLQQQTQQEIINNQYYRKKNKKYNKNHNNNNKK